MMLREYFAPRLRELREEKRESRAALAELLGVSVSQISEMENGRKGTSMERLGKLCRHYNVSADYLLGLTDEKRKLADGAEQAEKR